jgi:hypothetical protein
MHRSQHPRHLPLAAGIRGGTDPTKTSPNSSASSPTSSKTLRPQTEGTQVSVLVVQGDAFRRCRYPMPQLIDLYQPTLFRLASR